MNHSTGSQQSANGRKRPRGRVADLGQYSDSARSTHDRVQPASVETRGKCGPLPEPLTPQYIEEGHEDGLASQLEQRRTADQQYHDDEDVQAIEAALSMQEVQRARLSFDMSALTGLGRSVKQDGWYAIEYLYSLGQGRCHAPENVRRRLLSLYIDLVTAARQREEVGDRLSEAEAYLLYGPSRTPLPYPTNGGAVVDISCSRPADGPLPGARGPAQETQPDAPAMPDWPEARPPPVKTPNVDWSRLHVCGEPLDRIRNVVLASYGRPELLRQLEADEERWRRSAAAVEAPEPVAADKAGAG